MRARIIQIVSIAILVVLLIVLWRFLGDKAATSGAGGRGGGNTTRADYLAPAAWASCDGTRTFQARPTQLITRMR